MSAKVDLGLDARYTAWTFNPDDSEHHSLEEVGGRNFLPPVVPLSFRGGSISGTVKPSEGASTVPEMLPPLTGRTRGRQLASSTKPQPLPRTTRQSAKKAEEG